MCKIEKLTNEVIDSLEACQKLLAIERKKYADLRQLVGNYLVIEGPCTNTEYEAYCEMDDCVYCEMAREADNPGKAT